MNLDKLLSQPDWTEERLAELVRRAGLRRTNQSTINRLRNRKRTAGLELALAIEAATEGQVTAEDVPLSRRARAGLRRIRGLQQGASSSASETPPSRAAC